MPANTVPDPARETQMREYRNLLIKYQQEMIDEFGKAMLALAGGALGVSFAFIKDIVKLDETTGRSLLLLAWVSWGFSIVSILVSYYLSHLAMGRAIADVDARRTIHRSWASRLTSFLTASSIVTFLLGVLLLAAFVRLNFGDAASSGKKGVALTNQSVSIRIDNLSIAVQTPTNNANLKN